MARPGLEPGTPRFSVVRSRWPEGAQYLRLGSHPLEELGHLCQPVAVGLVFLVVSALSDVAPQDAVPADGGDRPGQREPSIVERDERAGRVGSLSQHAGDRDAEDVIGRGGVAVTRVPGSERQRRSAVQGSRPCRIRRTDWLARPAGSR